MNASRAIALLIALAPLIGVADEGTNSGADSEHIATLKSSLPSTMGFKVDNVHMTDAGVACITYRITNDKGGESRAQAVVEGDKVLRSTSRSSQFAKAWNTQCVSSNAGA